MSMDTLSFPAPPTTTLHLARPTHRFPRQTGQLSQAQMVARGFEFVRILDHWFWEVKFPPGWYKERDVRHPGWFLVCDEADRLRCQCMEGHRNFDGIVANWQRRYEPDVQWDFHNPCRQRWCVLDGGDIHHASEWAVGRPSRMAQFSYANYRHAVAYLNQKYPRWRSYDAYW